MEKITNLVVLGVIRNSEGELLISQRYEPELPEVHLKWDLVGGKNEFGESLEEALIREIEEETGLEVEIDYLAPKTMTKLWEYNNRQQHTVLICYVCTLLGGNMHLNDNKINELKWISKEEIDSFEYLPTSKEFLNMYVQNTK